jgi:hypothetical protein
MLVMREFKKDRPRPPPSPLLLFASLARELLALTSSPHGPHVITPKSHKSCFCLHHQRFEALFIHCLGGLGLGAANHSKTGK